MKTNNEALFVETLQVILASGEKQNKRKVDKIAQCFGLTDPTQIKELAELAIVYKARGIAQNETLPIRQRYDLIVELYRNQVNLSHRTSQSIMLQQYSTPAPIAFLASSYVNKHDTKALYFEPSAGNGLLTIALPIKQVIVNEIDEQRYQNLRKQEFACTLQADATEHFRGYENLFNGIVTNPPFGSLFEKVMYGEFPIKTLDHLMALRALDCMKDNGRAAIIIGGHTQWDSEGRIQKGKNRIFLSYLYRYYYVEDILLIDGDLYSRQGTSFDVRLILINERKEKPEGYAPLKDNMDTVISDFDTLFQRVGLVEESKPVDELTSKRDTSKFMDKSQIIAQAKKKLKQLQVLDGLEGPYRPAAEPPVKPLDTIVPDSMDYEIHSALLDVKEQVGGSINAYVRGFLHYNNDEEMAQALSAEQVDAVAMAIYNIEEKNQGMVIGDQTGIGKGRVAAAVIRYACNKGLKPIFITEKANLFSDMYRDLKAIGSAGLRPFIVNANESKSKIKDEDGEIVYEPLEHSAQENIFEKQYLGKEFDYVMLTYSQIASEKPTVKQAFINAIAENNVLILDESHNAGGNLESSATARFFYNVVKQAKGVVFLSATFAKRPDNMPLYAAKTCISDASLSNESLVEAIVKGGVALQEIISANLVAEGQMIRRERSFEGIEVNYISLDKEGASQFGIHDKEQEHKAIVDNITAVLRDIIAFQDKGVMPMVDAFDKAKKMEMTNVEQRKGTKELGVSATPYFSKVFNVINQMLFSVKAEEVAQRAIQRLQEGKAPVIAFSSTMGSFLENMETDTGLSIEDGAIVNADFAEVLKRGLNGILRYSEINEAGESKHKQLELSELPDEAREEYFRIAKVIENIATGISISPIDRIKFLLTEAGYSVAEVTGRKMELKFKNKESHTAMVCTRKKELVNDAFRKFNNNEVDVLLINQSGSTGASAHAIVTPKVPLSKIRQRVMIVLQAELDINREVQKRGRVNRTGQVFKPIYDYVNSAIPAEKRLAMMLQKKLKSLDANTTSNQKNSQALLKNDDFLNKYGDKLILDYLKDNPDINEAIGDPLELNKKEEEKKKLVNLEDAASRVAGRVAVLTTTDQQKFYDDMVERYQSYVAYLLQIDEYDLEVETMDLQAKTLDRSLKIAGKGGAKSFGGNTYLEKCEVNILKKPFRKQELDNIITESLAGNTADDIAEELVTQLSEYIEVRKTAALQDVEQRAEKAIQNITAEKKYQVLPNEDQKKIYYQDRLKVIEEAKQESIDVARKKIEAQSGYVGQMLKFFRIGQGVYYPSYDFGESSPIKVPTVFLGFKINFQKPNPFAPSAIVARFAVANSSKYFEFVLSGEQGVLLERIMSASYGMNRGEKQQMVDNWDELIKDKIQNRGKRYIYTGNLLQAYGHLEEKCKLINFTTSDGGVKKGILLPESWDKAGTYVVSKVSVPLIKAIKVLQNLESGRMVATDNGLCFIKMRDGYKITTSSLSVQRFDMIIKNPDILQYIDNQGGFQKVGSSWSGDVSEKNIVAMAKAIHQVSNCTVALYENQIQLIQKELEQEPLLQEHIFPKLVELEVKLFAIIKDQTNGLQGLGAVDVMPSLALLKQHYPINSTLERAKILAGLVEEVKTRTDNFTNATAIGNEKVEVKYLLEKEHIQPSQWIEYKHTFKRSEADVVEWLANEVAKMYNQNQTSTTTIPNTDRERQLKIAKLKAIAKIKLLELLK